MFQAFLTDIATNLLAVKMNPFYLSIGLTDGILKRVAQSRYTQNAAAGSDEFSVLFLVPE